MLHFFVLAPVKGTKAKVENQKVPFSFGHIQSCRTTDSKVKEASFKISSNFKKLSGRKINLPGTAFPITVNYNKTQTAPEYIQGHSLQGWRTGQKKNSQLSLIN